MKRWVVCIATAVVLLWVLLIPLAIAADPCLAMCVMFVCEGSCGASSGTTAPTAGTSLDPAAILVVVAPDHAVAVPLTVPKPPPKSSLLSA